MSKQACYSINRKANYVTIFNNGKRYPLKIWNELKTQHDMTHQEMANTMLNMENDEKELA